VPTLVKGRNGVDVQARHGSLTVERVSDGLAVALIPPQGEQDIGDSDLNSTVDADRFVLVVAGPRNLNTAALTASGLDNPAGFPNLALFGQADHGRLEPLQEVNDPRGGERTRTIAWDADVIINSGPSPELVIDAAGNVFKAVNASVRDDLPNISRMDGLVADDDIIVNDIVNDDAGEVLFDAPSTGVISGSQSLFTMRDTYDTVTITNASTKDLVINRIDVIGAQPTYPLSSTSRPRIMLEAPDVDITFNLTRDVSPTTVTLLNTGVSDIGLNGEINNPIGLTSITNTQGHIVNGSDIASFVSDGNGYAAGSGLVRTNLLDIEATQGNIGVDNTSPTADSRVRVELVESTNRPEDLQAVAGGSIFLDLDGVVRQRTTDLAPTVAEINVSLVSAGNHADIRLAAGSLEVSSALRDGVYVGSPDDATDAPDGTFRVFYWNDPGTIPLRDPGAYGASPTAIETNFNFALIEAGKTVGTGNIVVNAADPAVPTANSGNVVNVLATTNVFGTGHIDADSNGFIDLTESVADLRVGQIGSRYDDVTLDAPDGDIVDAPALSPLSPPSGDLDADIIGVNLLLTAERSIGSGSNFLEVDLLDAGTGIQVNGTLTATAGHSVFIEETDNDLRIDRVVAQGLNDIGQVTLVARDGSILDANTATEDDGDNTSTRVRDIANVVGRSIDLDADVDVGDTDDDLDIDSGVRTNADGSTTLVTGRVFAQAGRSVFLTESAREMNVLAVRAETGRIRLSVPDTDLADTENFALITLPVAGATARIDEGASATSVAVAEISAALSVDLWVGDNVTTSATGRVVSSQSITLRGDTRRVLQTEAVDGVNADADRGTQMNLRGTIGHVTSAGNTSKTFTRIFGHDQVDTFTFDGTDLDANTTVFGSQNDTAALADDGEDRFIVHQLGSMGVNAAGIGDTLTLDGQADTDTYTVNTTGSQGELRNYVINVLDTGAKTDGADTLGVYGIDGSTAPGQVDDIFLLRKTNAIPFETADTPAFVALLHGDLNQVRDGSGTISGRPQQVQRINYDINLNGRLEVYGKGGNDYFASDDNSTVTTLDGGSGDDTFQIGQLFGMQRQTPNVQDSDRFDTIATTRGYLSAGASAAIVAQGGSGNDVFTVYGNQAELRLEGDDGDDQFIVRAFALAQTNADGTITTIGGVAVPLLTSEVSTQGQMNVRPGEGNDTVQYNINAPVSVDGGAGFDKVVVLGTEFADNFVVTEDGVKGAGVNIRFENIEVLEVDGLESDDDFYVLATPVGVVTRVIGGLGSDSFNVGGDVAEPIIMQDLAGASGAIGHLLGSSDPLYDRLPIAGIDLTVAQARQGAVVITESAGDTVVEEGLTSNPLAIDSYLVRLAVAPAAGTTVYVTVSAARSQRDESLAPNNGDSVWLRDAQLPGFSRSVPVNGQPTTEPNRALVLAFDAGNWNIDQTVDVYGAQDDFAEGERTVTVSHLVDAVVVTPANTQTGLNAQEATRLLFDQAAVRNVEVRVIDDDAPGLIITQTNGETLVLEGSLDTQPTGGSFGIEDSYNLKLARALIGTQTVTVQLAYDAAQVGLSVGGNAVTSVTFTADNWQQGIDITVRATDDATREAFKRSFIEHSVSEGFADYTGVVKQLAVQVHDNDTPGAIVSESNGSTNVPLDDPNTVPNEAIDSYTLRLTAAPTQDVVVQVNTDGQVNTSPAALTFTAANWWQAQTVTVTANPAYVPASSGLDTTTQKVFAPRTHLLSQLGGPLAIEGGTLGERALVSAIVLPTELNAGLLQIGTQPDERDQIDTLNLYDDSSPEDRTGTLSATQLAGFDMAPTLNFGGTNALGEPSTFAGGITFGNASTGRSTIEVLNLLMGEGNDSLTITGTLQAADEGTGGNRGPARHGTITLVHGGGNLAVTPGGSSLFGDRITVTGGGGVSSPLVIYGDTSQDGLWYSGATDEVTPRADNIVPGNKLFDQVGTADDQFRFPRANPFRFAGNDIIDASALFAGADVNTTVLGVAVYGGAGNDVITGSQAGDHLAGGSGDDSIRGQDGLDLIYGDSGFNVDPITRTLRVPTLDEGVGSLGFGPVRDAMVAGTDSLEGNGGDDVIFGDHGLVVQNAPRGTLHPTYLAALGRSAVFGYATSSTLETQVPFTASDKLLSTGYIEVIETERVTNGAADLILGGDGRDRLLGGNGGDTITGGAASDVTLGDHGRLTYIGADYYGSADTERATLDEIVSLDVAVGGNDRIDDDASDDLIFGGHGNDTIDGGSGQNIVFGDHGRILGVDAGVNRPIGDPESTKTDDDWQVQVLGRVESIDWGTINGALNEFGNGDDTITTGGGRDMLFGGGGNDLINAYASGGVTAEQDGNNVVFGDHGLVDYLAEELAPVNSATPRRDLPTTRDTDRVWSLATGMGGADTIDTGNANDIVLGGFAGDTINAGHGKNIVFGDNGELTAANADDPLTQWSVHEFTIGTLVSTAFADGGVDSITSGDHDDILIGGRDGDTIDSGRGDNAVFGDQGRVLTLVNGQGGSADTYNAVVGGLARPVADRPLTYLLVTTLVDTGNADGGDRITTGIGRDMIFGGGGADTLDSFASTSLGTMAAGTAAQDGNNIVLGDHGFVDYVSEELRQGGAGNPGLEVFALTHSATNASLNPARTADIDVIASLEGDYVVDGQTVQATAIGGNDLITTGNRNDIVLGGTGDDRIVGGDGSNLVLGDNARLVAAPADFPNPIFAVHEFTICKIDTIGFDDTDSGTDIVTGGSGNDVLFGGGGDDVIYAGAGDDLVFGDQGRIECKNGVPYTPEISLRPNCWECFPTTGFLLFKATHVDQATGAGNDVVFGEDGSDVLLGQQGEDVLYGGRGDDILIGGSNVAGGLDSHDRIDGGDGHDAVAGDNAEICFRPDAIDVRMRALDGTLLYGVTPAVNDGMLMIGVANPANAIDPLKPWVNAGADPRYVARTGVNGVVTDKNSGHAEYVIKLLDHADTTPVNLYGNDYIAGGAGEDEIFGQLGNDVVQGDGTIGLGSALPLRTSYADSLQAAQLSVVRLDGSTLAVTDFIHVGANRGAVATDPAAFGFTLDPLADLQVRASFEGRYDADDYIEGGGGNDVVYGNRGQDDIVGGSSDLFNLVLASQRPDGSDLLFGGAGSDLTRNDIGEATRASSSGTGAPGSDLILNARGGHAKDADTILGDNGRLLRLVGVNATPVANAPLPATSQRTLADTLLPDGVSSTGGFLNYNWDLYGSNTDDGRIGTGSDGRVGGGYGHDGSNFGADAGRAALELFYDYDRIIVRGVHLLDYTPGGIDVAANAASDRGAGDEIHGESGDDTVHGQKGHDVLFGEGQDDDLIGGYGNDWISGGTGNDGVIGDDGRIMTSRNATAYGEALFGVVRLLADNGDTRTFNGNMMNEVIATPGTIQQAVANVGDEMKKAVNLTPFSFDTTFNGNADEFTSVTKKTVDDRGLPGAPNANDLIFGGLGDDWLHGGSGDDAISGGEALPQSWTQIVLTNGTIGVARSDYARPFNPGDALRYNPDDPDGWHFDRTRRAGEFALYDEYDPRRKIEIVVASGDSTRPVGSAVKDDRGAITIGEWFLNFSASEGTWVPAGTLNTNGQQATSYLAAFNDGADRIFGGTGNDWLAGGTGRDNLYGGFGNDLLNADDLLETNSNETSNKDPVDSLYDNEVPDTQPTYEDRAFGGAGRDVLIGNTGGDRLIDWVGEFNSYLVPFAPFGMATVSRTLQPQLAEFLYTLSASDGADPTRHKDTRDDPALAYRNGEPEGELGVVRQKDNAWQAQTGAPADPQAGNIPGGKRDVLRTANFNDGQMQALASDSGTWQVSGGALQVASNSRKADAVAVYQVGDALPSYFEVLATVKVVKPTAGWNANSYVIFDYQSPTNFKFAGLNVSTNKIEMGQRTAAGWQVLKQASFPGSVKNDTWYNLTLSVNGLTATLIVNNSNVFSHTFAATVVDGWSYGLNWGLVGFGSNKSRGAMDNIAVQVVPPAATVTGSDDFTSGAGPMVTAVAGSATGSWAPTNGRLNGAPSVRRRRGDPAPEPVGRDTDVGFVAARAELDVQHGRPRRNRVRSLQRHRLQVRGHRRAGAADHHRPSHRGRLVRRRSARQCQSGGRRRLQARRLDQGLDGQRHAERPGGDRLRRSTRSAPTGASVCLPAARRRASTASPYAATTRRSTRSSLALVAGFAASSSEPAPAVSEAELQVMAAAALQRLSLDDPQRAALGEISVRVQDLPGLALGEYRDGTLLIDVDAAGHGWFVDATPGDDAEYRRRGDLLVATHGVAGGRMDLLSVLAHELGHAAGLEHADEGLMAEQLNPGQRTLLAAGPSHGTIDLPVTGVAGLSSLMAPPAAALSRLPGEKLSTVAQRVSPPLIDWSGRMAFPANGATGLSAARSWVADFVNHLASTASERNPNAALRLQIEAPSQPSAKPSRTSALLRDPDAGSHPQIKVPIRVSPKLAAGDRA
jgi:Ca2+-binding RTX toxin-like protein